MRKNSGQSLVEYLVLVALVGVAAIGVVSVVGKNLREQYANVSASLRNEKPVTLSKPSQETFGDKSLDNFAESHER